MMDYMDPRNWGKEEIQECKMWTLCAGVGLALVYITLWIFY